MATPSAARHIVNFITGNKNKLSEVKAILEPAIQVESQALDLLEIQGTLEEVTLDKCRRAADLVSYVFLYYIYIYIVIHSTFFALGIAFFFLVGERA
jgi:inosine triphosphate pyrophosphatase